MAEERVIISVELDKAAAAKEAKSLEKDLLKLRTRQRELNADVKVGAITQEQYAEEMLAVKTQIKEKSAEQRQAIKVSQAEEGSVNALRAKLAQLTKQRNATNQATEAGVKTAARLDDEILQLNNRLKANEQAGGDFRRNVGNYTNSIIEAADATTVFGVNVGQARGAVVAATGGIQGTNTALKAFKVALVSTGIGALIVAIGTLVSYFTNTQRGADKVNQALSAIGATFDVLTDRASIFGEGLFQLFTGNFAQALDTFKQSITGIGDEIAQEGAKALQLERDRQELERQEIGFIREKRRLEREIQDLRTAGEDKSRGPLEREKALAQALQLQEQLTARTVALQQEKVRILAEQQALGENLLEDDRLLAEQQAELDNIRAQSQERFRTINNQLNATRLEASKLNADQIQEYRINTEINTLDRIGSLQDAYYSDPANDPAVRNAEQVAQLRIFAAKKELDAKNTLKALEAQVDAEVSQSKIENAEQAVGQVVSATRQETVAGKAAGIAQATISTYTAANKALNLPFPANIIAVAATIAKGLANVTKISGVEGFARGGYVTGPGTSTSDSIPVFLSKGESVINAKSTQMFAPQLSAMNQAGGGRPFSVPNLNAGYAQGGIIQSNRNVNDAITMERAMTKAVNKMKPQILDIQEFSRVQNRIQYKENQTSV